jgi:protein gp37
MLTTAINSPILAEHAAEIRRLGKSVVGDAVEIGQRLTKCKELVGHGNWLPWLEREFGWTDRHALNLMRVYEMSTKSENLSDLDLPISSLYLLAAPSTPAEARDAVLDRAANGERMTHAQVQATIAEAKPARKPPVKPERPPDSPGESETDRAEIKVRHEVSLDQWKSMSPTERRECLDPKNFPSDAPMNTQNSNGIEWAQKSWNPIVGCKHDCPYCYARDIALRFTNAFPHGFEPAFRPYMLNVPRNTSLPKEAMFDARFSHVFAGSMTDWFGRWVPQEWIDAVLDVMRENLIWKFLCLTKFPKRMAEFDLPPNMWPGTTVDLQARVANAETAFARIKELNPDAILWLSIEPLLEPLKFQRLDLFKWIVIGGASKSSQTPAWHPPFPWIMDLVAQAKAAGCQVYMKTNLLGNRLLELPFNAPIKGDPTEAPKIFHYLGRDARRLPSEAERGTPTE